VDAVDLAVDQAYRAEPVDHAEITGVPPPSVALEVVSFPFTDVGKRASGLGYLDQADLAARHPAAGVRADRAHLAQERDRPAEHLGGRRPSSDAPDGPAQVGPTSTEDKAPSGTWRK
jgi:hypothetical protein